MTLLGGGLALLSAGVVYGTDVFFAVVGKPALERVGDAALTETMGRLHQVGDVRMPLFGATALLSTLGLSFAAGLGTAASGFALLALVGLGVQLLTYLRVAGPVNRAQTAAAESGVTPANARELQRRWDNVIVLRACGMTVGMLGLSLCVLSTVPGLNAPA
ncbi:hypothetical protein [Deinococcus sp.]|uniref:hypothetical protein n=1 Tax=Deinococcus sp. TaxID=47478 RepID=UPI003C7B437B